MAVRVADNGGRLVRDLEDRKIQIRFGGDRAGLDGRRDFQSISCGSSRNAAELHGVLESEETGTKDAEKQECRVNDSQENVPNDAEEVNESRASGCGVSRVMQKGGQRGGHVERSLVGEGVEMSPVRRLETLTRFSCIGHKSHYRAEAPRQQVLFSL